MNVTSLTALDGILDAPLSSQQRSLWFLQQFDPSNSSYNESKVVRLRGPIDGAKLEKAIRALVERHKVLRTVYVSREDDLVQRVLPTPEEILTCRDAACEPDDKILHDVAAAAAVPFDLRDNLPIRGTLFRKADDEHILHLCIHHIATDGWSWAIILNEIFAHYRDGTIQPPGRQYAEYSLLQQEAEDEAALAPGIAFWRERLDGALPLEMPRDAQLQPDGPQGGSVPVRLPAEKLSDVKTVARKWKVTPFAILLATFKLMLARLSGQDDVTVGIPVSNRLEEDLESMVGMFVNTIAVRSQLSEGETFESLVRNVWRDWLQSLEHHHLPFDRLVGALQPDRDLARTPVFQAFFSFLRAPQLDIDVSGVNVEVVPTEAIAARFDLELSLQENSDGTIDGLLIYDRRYFRPATARTIASLYISLLDRVTREPKTDLWTIPLMSDSEARVVLHDWNSTDADIPDCAIPELFDQQASKTPDAVAILDRDGAITYRDLRMRADIVTARLLHGGVRPGMPVAVHMHRSANYVAACLGVLKSGAVFVPLDTSLPEARHRLVLNDCGTTVVLCDHRSPPLEMPDGVLKVDVSETELLPSLPPPHIPPSAAAYILYTSGSTGSPNGVVGTHRALVNRLFWMQSTYPLASADVCAAKTRVGFVDSLTEMLMPVLFGATLSVIGDDDASDPRRLLQWLAEADATRVVLVPSVLRAMLDCAPDIGARLPRLDFWVVSGETLTSDLAAKFFAACPGRVLLNLYGSTEVCGDATYSEVKAGEPPDIGRPIANMRCYVLGARAEPVPAGLPGDLWISGIGLAQEYLNRDQLTRERFGKVSASGLPGERAFRSGDRARYLPDGRLEFLGRRDEQMKLRGVRIDPGEVENALRAMTGVRDAVVLLPSGADGLVALVRTASASHDADWARSLRSSLAKELPQTLVPTKIYAVEDFPRTPSGKIDRRACLGLQHVASPAQPEAGMALTQDGQVLEDRMLNIWRSVLGDPGIEKDADFFDLGGHSLLAVRLVSEIEKAFGVRLPLALLFEAPTARLLASRLMERSDRFSAFLLEPGAPDNSAAPLFCLRGLFHYRDLAAALRHVVPVYAVLLDGEEELAGDDELTAVAAIEKIVEHYVSSIKRISPTGPYHLAGLSAGGLVAIEVAQRLKSSGDRVDLLALLDTNAPGTTLRKRMVVAAKGAAKALIGREDRRMTTARDIELLYRASQIRLSAEPYKGDVVLFRAMQSNFGWRPHDLGWSRFINGRIDLVDIPGDHLSMMREPFVTALASAISERLSGSFQRR
jgi:amino acid adenylation domain-containing protein